MNRETVATDKAPKAIGPYEQAIKGGEFVYTAGQIPIDPKTGHFVEGGIAAQTRQVLENLKSVLEAAGSSLDRVVKAKPARSTVAVAELPRGALVEIDFVAFV